MMKVCKDQTFWLGVMTALAVMFLVLLIGIMTNVVSLNSTATTKGTAPTPTVGAGTNDDVVIPEATEIIVEGISEDDWVRGDVNAPVTIVEFSDIDCPFCTRFHDTMNQVVADYDGQVNWVFRDFPLDALHPEARGKAIAAECVGKLGGNDLYWQYLDGLFASSTANELTTEAQKLGIDMAAFTACQEDPTMAKKVMDDEEAGALAGALGTPHSIIIAGDEKVSISGAQPYTNVKNAIDQALAGM